MLRKGAGGKTAGVTVCLFVCSITLFAQRGGRGRGEVAFPTTPPTNLRVLPPDTNIRQVMTAFREALGVQCNYCHMQGDFASDDNPKKNTARNMLRIAADVNASFPDGKRHVTCYTCHHGEAKPKTEPPAAGADAKPATPPAQ
jgi:Photosynthetic reaction centre cytochrome C subunit